MYIETTYMRAQYNMDKREQERLNDQGLNEGNEDQDIMKKDIMRSAFLVLILSKVFEVLVVDK